MAIFNDISGWLLSRFSSLIIVIITHADSKTKDPKVFKLGVGNNLVMSYKWYGFRAERSKVKVRVMLTATRRGFELYECRLVIAIVLLLVVLLYD